MPRAPRSTLSGLLLATLLAWAAPAALLAAGPAAPEVPVAAGVTFVIAVANAAGPPGGGTRQDVAQGDYEVVVAITSVSPQAIAHTAFIDGVDAQGVRRQASVPRRVLRADLDGAPLQVLGFHTADPTVVEGSTSLGPSRAIVDALVGSGQSSYAFRSFVGQPQASGMLTIDPKGKVAFPVLINGQRVELQAVRATGQMSVGETSRPFEHVVLADRQHPISLRIAYGPRGGGFPFKAEFAREVVRIDFAAAPATPLAKALERDCRVELPGIYFDFDQATLKPQSRRALEDIAAALRSRPQQRVRIEGHTDNIGGERYNDELSARRAAAVRTALERDHGVVATMITTAGLGARQPIETNDTLAGRSRNRRVELVRDCPDKPAR